MDTSAPSSMNDDSEVPNGPNQSYRMVTQFILKETESGRDNKGHVFATQVFDGPSISSIKDKLWMFAVAHLQPLAMYTGLPKQWTIQTAPPSIDQFNKFIVFKLNKHIIPNEDKLKRRLVKNQNETFTVLIYKWGINIRSASDLLELKKACVDPISVVRAGAAHEAEQQEIVQQLQHEKWDEHYEAYEATWRMWASIIHSKRAQYNVANEIIRPPPAKLIHLFTPTASGVHHHIETLRANKNMGLDVVLSCLEQHKGWKSS
ncbi:unnamed protein product [Aphanomyces euteiches]